MSVAEQDWVQQSLARLEELETQRAHLEAAGQTERLAEVDEEIASLYEVLESVAEQDEPPANATAPAAVAAAPIAAAVAPASPFDVPAAAPMAAAPMAAPMAAAPPLAAPSPDFATDYAAYADDDFAPKSKMPVVLGVLGVLVVGGGIGGWMMMNKAEPPPAAKQEEPGKVLQAGEIPDDTSEPKVAEGADVDRTRGTNFKEGPGTPAASRPRTGNRSKSSGKRTKSSGKNDRSLSAASAKNDPLAGID